MANTYARSVVLRAAGAIVAIAFWLGLLVLALNNLDTGLPDSEGLAGGWPFWVGALVVVVIVAIYLRRSGGPGWGFFILGLLIPEVAFFLNRLVATELSAWFWILVAVLVAVPLPARRRPAATP